MARWGIYTRTLPRAAPAKRIDDDNATLENPLKIYTAVAREASFRRSHFVAMASRAIERKYEAT